MSEKYDLIIVGSGFGGSLLAMIARRAGRSVLMLEKGTHPRFAIGESTTPLSNLLLEEIAGQYDLPRLKPLTKWGPWQKTYPDLACGLKRGFTFYQQPADPNHQLLVAASPNDESSDTHWYRAEFDHFLLREAQAMGVDYLDQVTLSMFTESEDGVAVTGAQGRFEGKLLVDATGPRGFLHKALSLHEEQFPGYPPTQALYSHFSGVGRIGDTDGPYPADDAALHHVFDGGWIWVLRFNNGLTSAGVAATDAFANQLGFSEGEPAWNRLLDMFPAVKKQFSGAKPQLPFVYSRRLSFLSSAIAGKRWAMLPSAAAFIDPLLSTGFPLTLLGVARLGETITKYWDSSWFGFNLETYAIQTKAEATATASLIGALYGSMNNFPLFASVSLLYFAAASFSETARRLDKRHLAPSFLLCSDPFFGPASAQLGKRVHEVRTEADAENLRTDILQAIEAFDVAGLCNPNRRNWYPVDPQDLIRGAGKLGGATADDVRRLLRRSGFQSVLE